MSNAMLSYAATRAAEQRAFAAGERSAHLLRLCKIVCAVVLGVCFWFSVPYYLPLKLDPDPMKAAANEAAAYEGNLSRQLAMPAVLLTSAYLLWRLPKRGRFTRSSKLVYGAVGYVGWVVASMAWSIDPAITRKRIVVFLINTVFIYALARVTSMLEMALLGFACTGTVAMISLVIDIAVQHSFAPFDPDYRFMGVMTANFQAMNLLVCLLCGLTLVQSRPRWLLWMSPFLTLFSALLFITRARVGTFICLGMMVFILWRMAKQHLEPTMRGLVLSLALTVVLPSAVFALGRSGGGAITDVFMMGRQDTQNTASLSNRAPLWAELMESVQQRPMLGSGFEAFWSPERVEKISFDQGWMVPHAHNTYLDQTLSLGFVGAALYAFTLLGGCVVAWRRYRRNPTESTLLPALLLTWMALLSLTESAPISPYLPTLIAYSCIVKLAMEENSDAAVSPEIAAGEVLPALPRTKGRTTGLIPGRLPGAKIRPGARGRFA